MARAKSKNQQKTPKEATKKVVAKPKKPEKVPGPVPASYAPRVERQKIGEPVFVNDVRALLNGIPDKDQYKIGDAEFVKEVGPLYKGAPEGVVAVFVKFVGAPEGHNLILSGIQPGTMGMTTKKLVSMVPPFSKDKATHLAQNAIWKYLRAYLDGKVIDTTKRTSAESKVDLSRLSTAVSLNSGKSFFAEEIERAGKRVQAIQLNQETIWEGEGGRVLKVVEATPVATAPAVVAKEAPKVVSEVKTIEVPVSTNLENIWEGRRGITEVRGVKFLVVDKMETIKGKTEQINAVSVYDAPKGHELFELGINTRITIRQLRCFDDFPLKGEDKKKEEKLWNFLRKVLKEEGFIKDPVKKEKKAKPIAKLLQKREVVKPVEAPAVPPLETLAILGTVVETVSAQPAEQVKVEEKKDAPAIVIPERPTDPKLIWERKNGVVKLGEMLFRVTNVKLPKKDKVVKGIYVHEAKPGTVLHGVRREVFISLEQLKSLVFWSPFPLESSGYKAQKRIWEFLDRVMRDAGLKKTEDAGTKVVPEVSGILHAPQYGRSAEAHPEHPTPQ